MLNTIGRRLPMLLIALATLMPSLVGTPVQAQEAPPPRPTGLEVTGVGYDSVTLTWDDPGDSSITHYQIFRRDPDTQEVGDFGLINPNTGSTDTDYTDTTVKPEKSYIYRVKAVNRHGASEWSNFARADTPAAPEPDATPETTTPAVTDGIVYDYADVADGHYAALDIAALAADGVLAGTDCQIGQFCPGDAIQRWVFAVWMVRVLDGGDPEITSSRFDDIPGQPWWENHVERLAELGVTAGCDVNPVRYCPTDTVTRAQMAAFLDRAFDLPEAPDAGFIDTLGVFSKTSIDRLYQSGITHGCSDVPLRFCPGAGLTRAQMATFLQRGRPTPNVAAVGDDLPPDVSFYDTPFPGISNVVISVNYCGPLGAFTESELKDETDKLNLQVARLFFNMESNGESIVKFGVGEIYTPTEATNQTIWANETITKWGGLDSDDNPCYKAVFDDQTNGTASNDSRNVALILAGVELGKKTVGNKTVVTHGFGPPGGALFDDIEPYVIAQPSTRYVLKYGSEPWYWLIAHEIGHAAYTLCHAFENYSTCAVQGADADVKSECRTGPANRQVADPDCGGDDRLKELANSIMSYSAYSGHSKLSISYVACEQKNWLGWHDKICGTPAAPPAPRIDEDDSRITVRWTSPRDDGWSPITGYYIQLTQNGPRRSMTLGPLDGDHHTFTGLTNGERYTVEVRADNMQGIGAWSDPADGVPRPRQQLPPDTPTVNAVVNGNTISASWSADDNGSPIDKWEIGGTSGEQSASTRSYRWTNQRPGTYVVRVRAHNAHGWSEWGPSNTVTVDGEDEPTLMVSRGGPGVAGSCTSASGCEWVHGSGSGWTPGAQFWIKCGDFVDTSRNIPVVYANRYVDSSGNLSWGNRICLSNSRHTVEVWTNSDDVVRAVIPAPTSVIPDRPSVRATVSGTTVEASWSANDNGSQIDKWEIEGVGEVSASTTSRPWPNQRPRTYVVRVRAHNAAGWSEWGTSNTVTVDGEDEPTLMVSRGGPGVAGSCTSASGCEWVHGSGSGWTPGAQFWIKCGDFVDTSRNIPVVYANRYVDSSGNLSWGNRICLSNSRHTVEVWTNSDDVVRAVIPAPTSVIPDRPSVRATVSGTTVEASWSANDNGSQIDKWEIEGVGEVSASTTSRPWPNQRPRTYVVRVRAHNAAGWSEWGTSNTVTVDGEDEPTLMVSRGGPGVAGSCTSASGCEWVHGSGSGWTPGAQFWIKCGDFVDTSRNIPVVYANRYVDSSGNLSWGNRICLSNSRHTVEVWTNSDDVVRAVIPAP